MEMKQVNGFYMPAGQKGKWPDQIDKQGFPSYQLLQIEASLKACGKHRRQVALDGGAHVGLWFVHLAHNFRCVHAFEPTDAFECLQKNAERFVADDGKEIHLYNAALSDRDTTLNMVFRKMGWWAVPEGTPDSKPMLCIRIDSLKLQQLDLLKLDVEGHELETLTGAFETIERCRPVVIIEDKPEIRAKKNPKKLLAELGMKCTWAFKHDFLFQWPADMD